MKKSFLTRKLTTHNKSTQEAMGQWGWHETGESLVRVMGDMDSFLVEIGYIRDKGVIYF